LTRGDELHPHQQQPSSSLSEITTDKVW
jgi:hypothetical protein